jgi:hypothetical protein
VCLFARPSLGDHGDVASRLEHGLEPGARHRLVVADNPFAQAQLVAQATRLVLPTAPLCEKMRTFGARGIDRT